jgi:erythromycin esterase-like protein
VIEAVRCDAGPLTGDPRDDDALLDLVGDERIVLLGEASHGTHDTGSRPTSRASSTPSCTST